MYSAAFSIANDSAFPIHDIQIPENGWRFNRSLYINVDIRSLIRWKNGNEPSIEIFEGGTLTYIPVLEYLNVY